MGFGGIVALLIKNAVKSAVKFELAIDPIIAKLETQCPPKAELDKIIKIKNKLTNALTQIETALTSIDKTGSTIDGIVKGVKIGVTVLKALPLPTGAPPGVGIPVNIINGFSDTLDTLGILLKEFGGVTSQISPALQIIIGTLATVQEKLAILDGLLVGCLESETEGMTDLEKEEFFQSLGIDLSSLDTTGGSNNPGGSGGDGSGGDGSGGDGNPNGGGGDGNTDVNETLESRLSPNSNNPIVYKEFTITLDNDAGNKFSFPSRRAVGTNGGGVRIVTPFSFSSSTEVLVNTIKFEIDQLGSLELSRLARESKIESLTILETQAKADRYYEYYWKYIEDDIKRYASDILSGNFNNLNRLYNQAVKGYRALLVLSPSNPYAISQLIELKKLQADAKSKYKPPPPKNIFPELEFQPFGVEGKGGQVRFQGEQAFKFFDDIFPGDWRKTTPNLSPFNAAGSYNGQIEIFEGNENEALQSNLTYKWNQLKYKWVQVGRVT